ncbi:MAG: putative Ig domain-containing protein, partial [Bacteroidota bacterium]
MKRNKRFYHWIKLQRKYRATQKLLVENNDNCLKNRLTTKLDRLSRRLRRLNEKWRIGISAAALTAWMAVMPAGEAQAQRTQFTVTDLPGTQIIGENTYDQSGYSVSTAGDINGDGIEDFIISAGGARIKDATSKDIAYVVFGQGSATPTTVQLSDLDGSNGFALIGEGGEYSSDGVVSEAGDLNGDGIDDLAVSQTSAGEVYVVFGKDVAASGAFASQLTLSDLDGTEGFKLLGENVSDETGVAMSSIEDINGDDISDLIIGASRTRQAGRGTGTTYVVFGKNTSVDGDFPASLPLADLDGTNGFELLGDSEGGYAGGSVSSAGDVNGDGHTDLIVGASGLDDNANRAGGAYVVFGKDAAVDGNFPASMDLSALDGSNGFKLLGEENYDGAGGSVSGAGDVNGDGFDDLIIGADGFDVGERSTGSVFVIFGKNTAVAGDFPATFQLVSVDGTNGFELVGESEYDALGRAVSEVGDVNGDGINDLLLGTSRTSFNGTSSGSVYVVFGKNTSSDGDFPARLPVADLDINTGYRISGEGGGDGLGTSVSNVGDVNQDGIADLLVGAPRTDKNGASSGTTYVVFGRSTTALSLNTSISDATAREEAAFSFAIPEETFFNPEGTPLTFSATQQDESPLPAWLSFDPATRTFSGTPAEGDIGQLAIRVTASDTDDPSISDVFTLTVINKFAQLFANLSVLTSETGFKLLGANENDFSGGVVSAAGDLNGDGIDDMLVSANDARRNGLNDAGAVYVVFGQQDGGFANEVKLSDLDGT